MFNTYFDIINELLDETEHADLIQLATDFIESQDSICEIHAYTLDHFEIKFEKDGYTYTIKGELENGRVKFSGFYRESDVISENISIDHLSSEGFKRALSTRNIYPLAVNKVNRLIAIYNETH